MGFPTSQMYEFPNIVNLEVYRGDCPCKCIHCPVGITEPGKRKERFGNKGFDIELYKKIAKEISEHPHSTMRIHSVGEPLMWEKFGELLELTREISVKSWIFTCCVTDDMSILKSICNNIDIVEVSVNSILPEDYRATKGIDAFERVFENIKFMHNFIISKKINTRLIVSRVESLDKTANEDFVRYWKISGLVDDAFVRSYHTYNNLMNKLYIDQPKPKNEPCLVHWARLNINVDGYAVVCFNELFKERLSQSFIIGNLREQKIVDVWHGSELAVIRKAELNNDYSALPLPCKDCNFCQPLFDNRQTSEHQIKQWSNENVEVL